jgi:phage host-nuclease inhibitor protein Gam
MSKRIKLPSNPLTRAEVENLVADIATAANTKRSINAGLDQQILELRRQAEPLLAEADAEIKNKSALVQSWAEANPEAFGKLKSLKLTFGTIGFRTGTPKLKTLSGFTFKRVLERLLSLPWGRAFVRVTEEIDREALIAASRSMALTDSKLREAGCRVAQDESFFIEPDLSAIENRLTTAA